MDESDRPTYNGALDDAWLPSGRLYGGEKMRLSPPTRSVFYLSLIFAALGVIANTISIPLLSGITYYLLLIGYILLFLGNVFKGL